MARRTGCTVGVLKREIPARYHSFEGIGPYFVPLFGAMYRGRLDAILRMAAPYLDSDGRPAVLEIGCGFGFFTCLLGARYPNARIAALDIMSEGLPYVLKLSRKYGSGEVLAVRGDAHTLPFEDGAFDLIFAMDCLEHVADAGEVLRQMYRVLRPGGLALISVPVEPPVLKLARRFYALAMRKLAGRYVNTEPHWQGVVKSLDRFVRLVRDRFEVMRESYYPLNFLGDMLNYDLMIVARKTS